MGLSTAEYDLGLSPVVSIWDGRESRIAMLSFKAILKEIQLPLGRGQLQYFTFELVPALRSCLSANTGSSVWLGRPAVVLQREPQRSRSMPAHQDDVWTCRPATVLDYGPATGKVQTQTEPAVMHNGKLPAQPRSLLSRTMNTQALAMGTRVYTH